MSSVSGSPLYVLSLLLAGAIECRFYAHAAPDPVAVAVESDKASSTFGLTKVQARDVGDAIGKVPSRASGAIAPRMHTVPLQKQLVPVMRNGRLVANKTAFFGQISVGNPAQAFTVVFDTGSGHLILPSTGCGSGTCMKHRRYNRSLSETAVDVEADGRRIHSGASERDQVGIAFGTGEVQGEFVEERVCLGDDLHHCVNMRVVVATSMTPEPFGVFAFDGVLGIGLNALTLKSEFSFFGEMSLQHPSLLPYFSVYLARDQDVESSISFGGFDARRTTSEIQWASVEMEQLGYWQVGIKSVRVGDVELDACADGKCRAILDTGTSLLGVPRPTTRLLSRLLARPAPEEPGASCLATAGPTLTFDLGTTVVTLDAEDYSQSAPVNVTAVGRAPRPICRSLIMPVDLQSPLGSQVFIFGEPVLRKYYTVYDVAQKRVGFTIAQHGSLTSPTEVTV